MTIPVIILSLTTSFDRRAKLGARLDSLAIAHRFFDAINGRSLDADEIEHLAPRATLLYERPLLAGEIGCAATHLAAIRQLAGDDHDFVCVMEDDAAPVAAELADFLKADALARLPAFDVLRLVSDRDRWHLPAWPVAHLHGRGIYKMARLGYGMQGQIYSRAGLAKIAAQVGPIRAPIDFVIYHDCHVRGLRVLEVRPGLIEHDLSAPTEIGSRRENRNEMSPIDRASVRLSRARRKIIAMARFVELWGPRGLGQLLSWWPPGNYFK